MELGRTEVIFGLLIAVPIAVLVYLLAGPSVRRWRRRRIRAAAPPAELDAVLTRNVSFYKSLPPELRTQLHGHVNVFLAEKTFIGAGESWHRGPIVLSWGDVIRGVANPADGFNVVLHEFAHKRVARRKNRVLDAYGLTSPPEFFAVATESFFEKSRMMKKRLPDLYEQLKRFYRVDPAAWPGR